MDGEDEGASVRGIWREWQRMTQARNAGYVESGQRLVQLGGREWTQQDLLAAAQRAELRNTGWPIGLVLNTPGLAPVPTPDGIKARLKHYRSEQAEDFWYFRKDGSYYVSRLFEEDFGTPQFTSSAGHPESSIWFDIRIWRIAEILLHSSTLYRELGIPPDEPYILTVSHRGLAGREFYVSTARRFVTRGRICQSSTATWMEEVTQDYVTTNLKDLVSKVAGGLFVLFAFAQVGREVVDEIVDDFLRSRL